jgi:hypothetical protein
MAALGQTFVKSQLELLRHVVDCLIPSNGQMPAASVTGAAEHIDSVAGTSARLRRQLLDGLKDVEITAARIGGDFASLSEKERVEAMQSVEASNPAFFRELVRHTCSAYYTTPEVLKRLGMEGRPPQPRGYPLERGNLDLIERVKVRGTAYRQV